MKKIINWLVISSADPEKLSLTVKGFLVGIIPIVSFVLHFSKINLGDETLTSLIDSIVVLIQAALGIVAGIVFVVGLVRKIVATIQGTHAGLNS